MVAQAALSDFVDFILFEDDDQGGHVKTQNIPADRVQRREVTSRGKESKFRVRLMLFTCVHGYLDASQKDPATLVILEATFNIVGSGSARFRSAELKLKFSSKDSNDAPPDIIAYAPFRVEERSNITFEDRRNKLSLGAALGACAPFKAEIQPNWERESSFTKRYFDRGSAGTIYNAPNDCEDSVWWSLQESHNPHQKEGIRPACRFAVLIRRTTNAPFTCDVFLKTDAAAKPSLSQLWNFKTSTTDIDDPINFDPKVEPQGQHTGINPDDLGVWAEEGKLIELTAIPGLEPLQAPEKSA